MLPIVILGVLHRRPGLYRNLRERRVGVQLELLENLQVQTIKFYLARLPHLLVLGILHGKFPPVEVPNSALKVEEVGAHRDVSVPVRRVQLDRSKDALFPEFLEEQGESRDALFGHDRMNDVLASRKRPVVIAHVTELAHRPKYWLRVLLEVVLKVNQHYDVFEPEHLVGHRRLHRETSRQQLLLVPVATGLLEDSYAFAYCVDVGPEPAYGPHEF